MWSSLKISPALNRELNYMRDLLAAITWWFQLHFGVYANTSNVVHWKYDCSKEVSLNSKQQSTECHSSPHLWPWLASPWTQTLTVPPACVGSSWKENSWQSCAQGTASWWELKAKPPSRAACGILCSVFGCANIPTCVKFQCWRVLFFFKLVIKGSVCAVKPRAPWLKHQKCCSVTHVRLTGFSEWCAKQTPGWCCRWGSHELLWCKSN